MPVSTAPAVVATLTGAEGVRMLHLACWRAVAHATLTDPMVGPVAYVLDPTTLSACEASRSVVCGYCGDMWLLGVFAHPEVVARVRRLVLVAGINS